MNHYPRFFDPLFRPNRTCALRITAMLQVVVFLDRRDPHRLKDLFSSHVSLVPAGLPAGQVLYQRIPVVVSSGQINGLLVRNEFLGSFMSCFSWMLQR